MRYSRWKKVSEQGALTLLRKGQTTTQVAKTLDCDPESIRTIRNKHNLPRAHYGPAPKSSFRSPKDTHDLAYLAGIIDGEGTVAYHNSPGSLGGGVPDLFVTNTDKPLMDWLVRTFGGRVNSEQPANKGYKRKYVWHPRGYLSTYDALKATVPYLRIKKRKAELAIQNIEWKLAQREGRAKSRGGRSE